MVPVLRDRPHYVYPGPGFDGQFYVQLSTDPLLLKPETAPALDNVMVRAHRILLPIVTWLLSGGSPGLVLWVYPLLNLVAWIALAVMAWRILPRTGVGGPAAFLAIVLGPGAVESASRALSDLPAFVLAFASLSVPTLGGAVLLALAGLGRETVWLAWPARQSFDGPWWSHWRRWMLDGVITVAPLALWMISLQLRFWSDSRVDDSYLGLPLSGVMSRFGEMTAQISTRPLSSVADLVLHPAMQSGMLILSMLAQFIYLVLRPQKQEAIWRWGLLSGVFVLCLSWSTWEAFYTVTRHLLPLHMAFNLLLVKASHPRSHRWMWFALGNLYAIPRVLMWISFP